MIKIMDRKNEILANIQGEPLPEWDSLPDIDLYMDQVLMLVGRYLHGSTGRGEKLLTASMVNNYVKMKVIPAPVGKRYSRSHMACLLMICIMKSVIPIASIQLIFSDLDTDERLKEFYEGFRRTHFDVRERVADNASAFEGGDKGLIISSVLRAQAEQSLALELLNEI